MSFTSPWYLFALAVVPAVFAFALLIDRQRSKYPVSFPNLELLFSIGAGVDQLDLTTLPPDCLSSG